MTSIEPKLNTLHQSIKAKRLELLRLINEQVTLKRVKTEIRNEIDAWYKGWMLWNEDDFIEWIMQIDNAYFKFKLVYFRKFDRNEFGNKLNEIVNRFDSKQIGGGLFEGYHLCKFDILDVQQLLSCLDVADCRKLFDEITKLTESERNKEHLCSICAGYKKEMSLECGHILCSACSNRLSRCPFCKQNIRKDRIRKVFL